MAAAINVQGVMTITAPSRSLKIALIKAYWKNRTSGFITACPESQHSKHPGKGAKYCDEMNRDKLLCDFFASLRLMIFFTATLNCRRAGSTVGGDVGLSCRQSGDCPG
jgi:hypothetical protein